MKLIKILIVSIVIISTSCSENTSPDGSYNGQDCIAFLQEQPNGSELVTTGLEELKIEGDCLVIRQGFSGCDDDHKIDVVAVSDPANININVPYYQVLMSVYDSKPQDCEAYFVLEISYDLTTINVGNDYDLKLIFTDHNQDILYER